MSKGSFLNEHLDYAPKNTKRTRNHPITVDAPSGQDDLQPVSKILSSRCQSNYGKAEKRPADSVCGIFRTRFILRFTVVFPTPLRTYPTTARLLFRCETAAKGFEGISFCSFLISRIKPVPGFCNSFRYVGGPRKVSKPTRQLLVGMPSALERSWPRKSFLPKRKVRKDGRRIIVEVGFDNRIVAQMG